MEGGAAPAAVPAHGALVQTVADRLLAPVWAACRSGAPVSLLPPSPPSLLVAALTAALGGLVASLPAHARSLPALPPLLTSSDLLRPEVYAAVLNRPPHCTARVPGGDHAACAPNVVPCGGPWFVSWCLPAPVPRGATVAPGSGLAMWDGVRPLHSVHGGGWHPGAVFALVATQAWSLTRPAAGISGSGGGSRAHTLQLESPRVLLAWQEVASAAGYALPPAAGATVSGVVTRLYRCAPTIPDGAAAGAAADDSSSSSSCVAIEIETGGGGAPETIIVESAAAAGIVQWCVTPGMLLAWTGLSPAPVRDQRWWHVRPPDASSPADVQLVRAAAVCLAGMGGGSCTEAAIAAATPAATLWALSSRTAGGTTGGAPALLPPAPPEEDAAHCTYTGLLTGMGASWLTLDDNPRVTLWVPPGVTPQQLLPPGGAALHTALSLHGIAPLLVAGRVAGLQLAPGRSSLAVAAFPRCTAPPPTEAAAPSTTTVAATALDLLLPRGGESLTATLYRRHVVAVLLEAFRGMDPDANAVLLCKAITGGVGGAGTGLAAAAVAACAAIRTGSSPPYDSAVMRHVVVTPTTVAHFAAAAAAACVAALAAAPPGANPWLPVYQDDARASAAAARGQCAAVTRWLAAALEDSGQLQGLLPGAAAPAVTVAGDWLTACFTCTAAPLLGVVTVGGGGVGTVTIGDNRIALPCDAPPPAAATSGAGVHAWQQYSVVIDVLTSASRPAPGASPASTTACPVPRCTTCLWDCLATEVAHTAMRLEAAAGASPPTTPAVPLALHGWYPVPAAAAAEAWFRVRVVLSPAAAAPAAPPPPVPTPLPVLGVRDLLGGVGALWSDPWTAAAPARGGAASAVQQLQLPQFTLVGRLCAVTVLAGEGGSGGAGAGGGSGLPPSLTGLPPRVAQVRLRLANVDATPPADALATVPALAETVDVFLDLQPRGGAPAPLAGPLWPAQLRPGAVVVAHGCTRNKTPSLRVHVKCSAPQVGLTVLPSSAAAAALLSSEAAVIAAVCRPSPPLPPTAAAAAAHSSLAAIHQRVVADCANLAVEVKAAAVSWLRLAWVDATSGALLVGDEVGGVPLPRHIGRTATPLGALVGKAAADATPAVFHLVTTGSFRHLRLVTGNPAPPPATLAARLLKPSFLADDTPTEVASPLTTVDTAAAVAAAITAASPPAPPPAAPVLRLEVTLVVDDGTAECLLHVTDVYDPAAVAALLAEFCDTRCGTGAGGGGGGGGGATARRARRARRREGWRRRRGLAARLVGMGGGRIGFWGLQALLHGPLESHDGFGSATWAFDSAAGARGGSGGDDDAAAAAVPALSAAADAAWRCLDADDDFDARDYSTEPAEAAPVATPPTLAPDAMLLVPPAVRLAFDTAHGAATELFREVTDHVQRCPGGTSAPRWRLLARQFYTPPKPTSGGSGGGGVHEVVWRATASRLAAPPGLPRALAAAAAVGGGAPDGSTLLLVPSLPPPGTALPMPPRRTTQIDSETAGIRVPSAALPSVHLKALAGRQAPVAATAAAALATLAAFL